MWMKEFIFSTNIVIVCRIADVANVKNQGRKTIFLQNLVLLTFIRQTDI